MKGKPFFETATIFGVGLIGGSLARVLKGKKLAGKIIGVGRGGPNLDTAMGIGIIDEVRGPEEAVKNADLVVLCTPVMSIVPMLGRIAPHIKKGALVTDVGSTKRAIVEEGERIAAGKFDFIGSHPIAGTEKSGAQYSFETLFEGHKCVITPTPATDRDGLEKLRQVWLSAGMRVIEMDSAEHDRIFAAISHLPHMVAFALVNAVEGMGDGEKMLGYSGGGFRDATRIAASPPEIWADIALSNSEALVGMMGDVSDRLVEIREAIREKDREKLLKLLAKANAFRNKLK